MESELTTFHQPFECNCFICGGIITDVGCDILGTQTPIFNISLADKLGQVLGDKYLVVISKEDKVCYTCITLINHLDEVENEMFITKKKILALLESTYKLTCDVIEVETILDCEVTRDNCDNGPYKENGVHDFEGWGFSPFDERNKKNADYLFEEISSPKSFEDIIPENGSLPLENKELVPCDDDMSVSIQSPSAPSDNCLIISDCKHSTVDINPKLKETPKDFYIANTKPEQTPENVKKEPKSLEILQNNIFLCEICDVPFPKPYLLSRHKKVHLKSNKKVICPVCNEECHDRVHYIYHRKNKHDILKRLTCSLCNINFSNSKDLKNHLLTSHNSKNLQCDSCGCKFKSYTQFANHKLYAHGKKNCRVCGKHIPDSFKLRQHEYRHVWIESKNLICDVCGRVFKTPGGLRVHKVSHTGKYKLFCEFCGRGFMSSVILEEHKGVHTKEERYVCDICGRKFVLYSTFHLHKQWHADPLPFPCNICKKRFKYRSVRSVHIRRDHTGENPYKCHYCSAEFLKSISLKKHLTLHTKEFPYNCGICFKGFIQKRNLSKHMSRIHNDHSFILQPKVCEYKVVLRPDEFPLSNN